MELIEKRPYELSLWEEDIRTDENGVIQNTERKICVIGTDKITSPIAAFNIQLNQKINGEKTLTFSVCATYWDQDEEENLTNPYLIKLVNERKVKLRWKDKWHDFVIKGVSEDSKSKVFTYTAKDQHVQELAKNGYNIQFDQELENSIQTAQEFATEILRDTNWSIGKCDHFRESTPEALYEFTLKSSVTALSILDDEVLTISAGKKIFAPYSLVQNKAKKLQFLYSKTGAEVSSSKDDEGILIEGEGRFKNYYIDIVWPETGYPDILLGGIVALRNDCRGKHYVRLAQTKYDSNIKKYVNVYKKESEKDKTYYGFTETEYLSQSVVENLFSNSSDFTSTTGWKQAAQYGAAQIEPTPPRITANISVEEAMRNPEKKFESLLELPAFAFCSGFYDNRAKVGELIQGEQYAIDIEYPENYNGEKITRIALCEYTIEGGYYRPRPNGLIYFEGEIGDSDSAFLSCNYSLPKTELNDSKIGIFLTASGPVKLKSIALYKKVEVDGEIVKPNQIIFQNKDLIVTKYFYYEKTDAPYDLSTISYTFTGMEPNPDYILQYDETYEKKRSLTASKSNRFNLLQKVCETFECWLDIQVEHEEDGRVKSKKIGLREFVGDENFSGFKYGVNLGSIKRNVDSDAIVTKMIVEANANEFAQSGFCSIARAPLNPSGTNVVYNFDYYINQELLAAESAQTALSSYYQSIKAISDEITDLQNAKISKQKQVTENDALAYFEKARVEAAQKTLMEAEEELNRTFQHPFSWFVSGGTEHPADVSGYENLMKNTQCVSLLEKIVHCNHTIDENDSGPWALEAVVQSLKGDIEEIDFQIKEKVALRLEKENEFHNKIGRFIQEGSWISEEYTDDNLYYLDSLSTLYASSRPRVSYTIDVFDFSSIEGYENYAFKIGDKTFVQDPEFFGWVNKNGVRTPRQESVVISEVTEGIDNITKNTIKVQNYKTQFEDLFQRIAAATEALQYNSGRYEKFSGAIDSEGAITQKALQSAVDKNGLTINGAGRQSVSCDDDGLTTTDSVNPSSKVRIVGGGVFLTDDGGLTWSTGITGDGINADVITAGRVDTGKVNIVSGGQKTHVWDEKGITAYKTEYNTEGVINKVVPSTFVRQDEFGIYGIKNDAEFNARKSNDGDPIGKIKNKASYALTWDGFMLRSSDKDGRVEIDSEDDIVVYDESGQQRVKIGRLDDNKYGTKIIGAGGNQVIIGEAGEVEGKSIVIDSGADGKKFQVLEDGTLKATGAEISGNINMIDGTISWKAPNTSTGVEIDGLNDEINTLHTQAQLGISNAADALTTAQGADQKATNAVQKATNAETNAKKYAKEYADTEIGKLDKAVSDYLGIGGNTIVAEDYVISPYIGGGYLNVTGNKTRVIIDPSNQSQKNQVLAAFNTDTNKTIFGIDRDGNASFEGAITATSLTLGSNVKVPTNNIEDISNYVTNDVLSSTLENYTTDSEVNQKLTGYATTGELADYLKTNDLEEKLGEENVLFKGDISTTSTTDENTGLITTISTYIDENGIKQTNTIYTYPDSDYVLLNRDNQWGTGESLVKIEKDGLLEANNAIIHGTVYATDGEFSGTIKANAGHIGDIDIIDGGLGFAADRFVQEFIGSTQIKKYSITSVGSDNDNDGILDFTATFSSDAANKYHQQFHYIKGGAGIRFTTPQMSTVYCTKSAPTATGQVPYYYRATCLDISGQYASWIPGSVLDQVLIESAKEEDDFYLISTDGELTCDSNSPAGFKILSDGSMAIDDARIGSWKVSNDEIKGTGFWSEVRLFTSYYGDTRASGSTSESKNYRLVIGEAVTDGKKGFRVNRKGNLELASAAQIDSDAKKKNSVEPISSKYSELFDKLNPVRFKMNNGTSGRYHTGLIAQELESAIYEAGLSTEEVATLCIDQNEDGTTDMTVRYEELIALCIKEIQDLKKEVSTLKTQIQQLQS